MPSHLIMLLYKYPNLIGNIIRNLFLKPIMLHHIKWIKCI